MEQESFLESNLLQTIVMAVTVCVTAIIYWNKKRNELRAAATILKLQIQDIEVNIENLKAEAIVGNCLSEQPLYYSKVIFEENNWLKYNYMFADKLGASNFETIDKFFKIAQEIKTQQIFIKMKIQDSINAKCSFYYLQQYNRLNQTVSDIRENKEQLCMQDLQYTKALYNNPALSIGTYIHQELCNGLEKGLNKYQRISGNIAFQKLCKVGGIIS
ncbi:hypothetical protein [Parabacteroides sp. AF17-28]|uniref:hypothetical protein n=1 Tax=Parabacteroides sp. AF17-28 TaxID=2292241 RepID=UPI001F3C7DE0|nr:hypothetical protein [Parabacteroides sp. AF17-28]